ncbi:hypothetical protein HF086_004776, partial [Spodoptera exigua]
NEKWSLDLFSGISTDPSATTQPTRACSEDSCSQHSQHSCEQSQNDMDYGSGGPPPPGMMKDRHGPPPPHHPRERGYGPEGYGGEGFVPPPPMHHPSMPPQNQFLKTSVPVRGNEPLPTPGQESVVQGLRWQQEQQVLHFFNTPPDVSDDQLLQVFKDYGVTPPHTISKSSSGLMEFQNISQSVMAIMACNHATIQHPGAKFPFVMKLCFSSSRQIGQGKGQNPNKSLNQNQDQNNQRQGQNNGLAEHEY